MHFLEKKFGVMIQTWLKFVASGGLIDKKSALVNAIAWQQTADKPLP